MIDEIEVGESAQEMTCDSGLMTGWELSRDEAVETMDVDQFEAAIAFVGDDWEEAEEESQPTVMAN